MNSFIFSQKSIFSILIFFSLSSIYSQNLIEGTVVNLHKEKIPFSTIHILDNDKKALKISSANNSGSFEVDLDTITFNRELYIYASYLDDKSDTLVLIKNKPVQLEIKSNETILSEIIINAEKPLLVSKSDRLIYTPNKILKEGLTALELLRIAPLIDFDPKSNAISIINKENTIIIINGRKSNLPKEMITSLLQNTPAKNIKNIEIITAPGSEYSANTTGGVLNINLNKNLDEGFLSNLSLTSEQTKGFNTSILNGSINFRNKKIGIRISPFLNKSFNYNSTDNSILTSDGQKEVTIGEYERKYLVIGGGFGLDYDIDDRNLLSINGFISQVDGNSFQNNTTNYFSSKGSSNDSIYFSPIKGEDYYIYNFGNIFYEHKFDSISKKLLVVNIDYNKFKKDNIDIGSFSRKDAIEISKNGSKYKNVFPQDFYNISGSVDYSVQINDKSKINIGSTLSTSNFENELSYFSNSSNSNDFQLDIKNKYRFKENYLAGYISYSKTFNDKLNATFGIRIEGTDYLSKNENTNQKIDSTYVNLFPNLSIAYAIKERKTISFSLSRKIKRPAIESLLPGRTYINPNYFSENNPFLQPVIYYNVDAMYAINYKYYLSTGFSYMDNQSDRFIIPVIENDRLLQKSTDINYGSSTRTYLQFYTIQNWLNGLWEMNLSSSLNFLSFKDETNNLSQTRVNNFNYLFNLNNTLFLTKNKDLLLFITFRYSSPIENVSFKRENPLFKSDLGIKKTFNNFSMTLYASDIFNSYNESRIQYKSNLAHQFNQQIRTQLTQSISMSLTYNFGNSNLNKIKNKKIANDELKNRL